MRKFYVFFLATFLLIGKNAMAQTSGDISGKVLDEIGDGAYPVNIMIVDEKGVNTGAGTQTDFDGKFSIKPLNPGKYNIKVTSLGYADQLMTGIIVSGDKSTYVDIKLSKKVNQAIGGGKEVVVTTYRVPLIDPGVTTINKVTTADDLKALPTQNLNDAMSKAAGVFQSDAGKGISVRGSREGSSVVYINGMKTTVDISQLPKDAIEEMDVMTGGIGARYGDATGAVTNITLKKPSGKFSGSVSGQTSQGLDAFGYNMANASLNGPIIRTKKKENKRTILGFSSSFQFLGRKDASPSAVGTWQVKNDVLNDIKNQPIQKLANGSGFYLKSEDLTFKDLYKSAIKPNNSDQNYNGSLTFDVSPAEPFMISVGGTGSYKTYHKWIEEYSLLNAENNPLYKELNYRTFFRFTHRIKGKKAAEGENKDNAKKVKVENMSYTLQVDFEKIKNMYGDDSHWDKLFNYGYIGDFRVNKVASFTPQSNFTNAGQSYNGFVQNGYQDVSVDFKPGTANTLGTRFTDQYYQQLGATMGTDGYYTVPTNNVAGFVQSINQISSAKALINGKRSDNVYGLWYNVGRQYNGYAVDKNNEQYRARLEFAFDIVRSGSKDNKHSILIGAEYEQRIERKYSVNPLNLWDLAYQKMNLQFDSKLDTMNPTYLIGGVKYHNGDAALKDFGKGTGNSSGVGKDTILLQYKITDSLQTTFDRNIRKAIGAGAQDYINIYGVSLDKLNIGMFSATDLLSYFPNGNAMITARGYDYSGRVLGNFPSANQFFNDTNSQGQATRLQSAYHPTYASAYIEDKFSYNQNFTLRIGLRTDYFNANQAVLKDPYSLYRVKTVSEVTDLGSHPTSMGSNYSVYADDANNPTAIVGYRNGDQWYDRNGTALASGRDLAYSTSHGINPILYDPKANIQKVGFNTANSFTNYKAALIIMPRMQFAFNISDRAQFFAHYDVLSQRPQSRNQLDLTQYLYWRENTAYKNNPNLRPERTVDFEFGYKQRLSDFAAVTVTAYYREFRDMIQVKKIYQAYPLDYTSFGNVDFGSTKGLSLALDFRRFHNFKVDFNYTLQFAEGTGSNDASQQYLVSASTPNLRTVFPLDYDARNTFNAILDYRFASGKEYKGPKTKSGYGILEGFGVNFSILARSGTPYTDQATVTGEGAISVINRAAPVGSINGSRRGWYFRSDMRINKDFSFMVNKKKNEAGEDKSKRLFFQVYLMIENLFNTKNAVNVYRFTGSASDDGYLTAPSSQTSINGQLNPQAYKDLYKAKINSPVNYSLPRRIYLGLAFNF